MQPSVASTVLLDYCRDLPVVPVLTIDNPADARPLAKALVAGGLTNLEITLRTGAAIDAIRAVAGLPGCRVGAGSLLTHEQVVAAKAAGACFGVSPGATESLVRACEGEELPLLPGASTATEIMRLLSSGFSFLKFFPAEAAGGLDALKSFAGPLPQAKFCPTGGIRPGNAADYIALKNVVCVGGSWIAPSALIAKGDWSGITERATLAAQLVGKSAV